MLRVGFSRDFDFGVGEPVEGAGSLALGPGRFLHLCVDVRHGAMPGDTPHPLVPPGEACGALEELVRTRNTGPSRDRRRVAEVDVSRSVVSNSHDLMD